MTDDDRYEAEFMAGVDARLKEASRPFWRLIFGICAIAIVPPAALQVWLWLQ